MSIPWGGKSWDAVKMIERGHTVRETASALGVTTGEVRSWWRRLHPHLPIHEPGPEVEPLRFIGAHERTMKVALFECPHCGGLIDYVSDVAEGRPWHCEWCGREVR